MEFPTSDPVDWFTLIVHLREVSGSEYPHATDEMAHHYEDQEEEGKLFNTLAHSHLRSDILELALRIALKDFEQPDEPCDLDQLV